jgi:hypothetical protein
MTKRDSVGLLRPQEDPEENLFVIEEMIWTFSNRKMPYNYHVEQKENVLEAYAQKTT